MITVYFVTTSGFLDDTQFDDDPNEPRFDGEGRILSNGSRVNYDAGEEENVLCGCCCTRPDEGRPVTMESGALLGGSGGSGDSL